MSLQQQFNKFEEKIKLTWNDEKLKTIREKDESIRSDIKAAFKEKGYPVKNSVFFYKDLMQQKQPLYLSMMTMILM